MIHLNVHLTVKEAANVEEVAELLKEQCRQSRAEPGCAHFNVYHSQSEPQSFLLVEHWESAEALDAHRNAPAFNEIYKPKVLPLVDRVPHECDLLVS